MSALPPESGHVRCTSFGPKADIGEIVDHQTTGPVLRLICAARRRDRMEQFGRLLCSARSTSRAKHAQRSGTPVEVENLGAAERSLGSPLRGSARRTFCEAD